MNRERRSRRLKAEERQGIAELCNRSGFDGDISLALDGAPRGLSLSGGLIPAGQDRVRLTPTVPSLPLPEPVSVSLEGRTTIQGQQIRRLAVSVEDHPFMLAGREPTEPGAAATGCVT